MKGHHITLIRDQAIVQVVRIKTITLETCRANAAQYARLVHSYRRSGHPLSRAQEYALLDMTDPLFI